MRDYSRFIEFMTDGEWAFAIVIPLSYFIDVIRLS